MSSYKPMDTSTHLGNGAVPKFAGSGFFMPYKSMSHGGHTNPAFQGDDAEDGNDDRNDDVTDEELSESELSTPERRTSEAFHNEETPEKTKFVLPEHQDFNVGLDDLPEKSQGPPPPPATQHSEVKKPQQSWNRFRTTAQEQVSSQDLDFWNRVFVGTKIVFCTILFLIMFGTAVVSKICFVIMTANLAKPDGMFNTTLKTFRNNLKFPVDSINVMWVWGLTITMAAPYVFTIGRCLWKLVFQVSKRKGTNLSLLIKVLIFETLHSVGLHAMVYIVVPSMDPMSGVLMTLTVAVVPGLLKILYPATKRGVEQYTFMCLSTSISIIGAAGQLAAIALWCYTVYGSFNDETDELSDKIPLLVCLVLAPFFISATWWENYVYQGKKNSTGLPSLVRSVRRRRTKLALYVNIWKLILTLILPITIYGAFCGTKCIDVLYFQEDNATEMSAVYNSLKQFGEAGKCSDYLPLVVASIGIFCSGVCFKTAKVGCKIMSQIVDFSLPLALSTPATIGIILGMYSGFLTSEDAGCSLPFPVWNRADTFLSDLSHDWKWLAAALLGFLSLLLVTNHIWSPGNERLQRTDKLFVQPLYCGILPDQSLILNRRRIEDDIKISDTQSRRNRRNKLPLPEDIEHDPSANSSAYKTDDTPMIYMCATMWHENENEMTQLLKSIFRMDEDQCTRKNTQFLLNQRDPDYYEFEAHIFFDDAFESHKENEYNYSVNDFVKELIKTVQFSASAITGVNYKIAPPQKVAAPYGGRLVWNLPGGNQLVAHLKDKAVIRHRKRWSQVMYMYYFLGFRMLKSDNITRKRLAKRAENTFLLALDGDVDFQPNAVQLLVDRMKKNTSVGAACGRIHPIGAGAMIWYQKFEYAISHWLQKAAEDKLGCVLCSPGCFSLFRGSALMDDNVMQRYTTPPVEARHYVQYDQGEDRWLCTLLLQQGHRVEYCAASDALTFAPEGFYEFFNQRRRWMPSTLANILDLLTDWRNVTVRNPDISFVYILYQSLMLVSSIITPGTIFLLILGAINMAYPQVDLWASLLLNALPIGIFVWLCFAASPKIQLLYAAILSGAYSLVMMVVIVGLLQQATKYGFCSVTTIFLLFLASVFIISALLHPQEFWCLLHGFLYFLAIPAMSMILILYSLSNLHVVSWGTRENKSSAEEEEEDQDLLSKMMRRLSMCCPAASSRGKEDTRLHTILDRLDGIEQSLRDISTFGSDVASRGRSRTRSQSPRWSPPNSALMELNEAAAEKFSSVHDMFDGVIGDRKVNNVLYQEEVQTPRDRMLNPYWLDMDDDLQGCRKGDKLPVEEVSFWEGLMEEYLKPIEADVSKQKDIQANLVELRNKVCLIVILLNSLFIIIVFSLQQVVASGGSMKYDLPCAKNATVTDGHLNTGQSIEPISVAFTLVFGVLLLIQFLCMLMHRFATLLHICASTQLFKEKRKAVFKGSVEDGAVEATEDQPKVTWEQGMELVRNMQRDREADTASLLSVSTYAGSEDDLDDDANAVEKKKLAKERWSRLARRRKVTKGGNTLGANFRKNFTDLQEALNTDIPPTEGQTPNGGLNIEETAQDLKSLGNLRGLTPRSIQTLSVLTKDATLKRSLTSRKLKQRKDVAKKRFAGVIQGVILENQQEKRRGDSTDGAGSSTDLLHQAVLVAVNKKHVKDAVEKLNSPSNEPSPTPSRHTLKSDRSPPEVPTRRSRSPARGSRSPAPLHRPQSVLTDDSPRGTDNQLDNKSDNQSEFRMQIPKVTVDQWPSDDELDNTKSERLRNSDVLF